MHQGQRSWLAVVALLLFILGGAGLADSDQGKIECIPEQPWQIYLGGDELSFKGSSGVPRDQILLEVFMRPT